MVPVGFEQCETDLKEIAATIDSRCLTCASVTNVMITLTYERLLFSTANASDALFYTVYVHHLTLLYY